MTRSWQALRWPCFFFALALLAGPVSGCSKKEPRYPADHERFQRIDAAIEALRSAYVRKNLSAIQSMFLPSGKLDRVEQEVAKDFETFQEITLDLSIDRIVIDGEMIDVYVHWQGLWKRNETDTGLRGRGHGMFRWTGEHSILLHSVDGDVPFGMSSRKAESTPKSGGSP
jgi:hypothetical protein